ncbi:MAG: hypothetical protein GX589_05230 [Deltaproteobacteria bacterium]|nr:hypothetical protein [Deltaproteobacteria bacterium]
MQNVVFVHRDPTLEYPQSAPFSPAGVYPEFQNEVLGVEDNRVFDAVRQLFRLAGLDSKHYGTPDWNPLGSYVRPGG